MEKRASRLLPWVALALLPTAGGCIVYSSGGGRFQAPEHELHRLNERVHRLEERVEALEQAVGLASDSGSS